MRGMAGRIAVFTALGLLLGIAPAQAQVYTWTDEHGSVHMTDNEGEIPAKYRKVAAKREDLAPFAGSEDAGGGEQRASRAGSDDEDQGILRPAIASAVHSRLGNLPAAKQKLVVDMIMERIGLFMTGAILIMLAQLAMFFHAVANGAALWAFGHAFLGFTVPIYALVKVEEPTPKLFGFAAWLIGTGMCATVGFAIGKALAAGA